MQMNPKLPESEPSRYRSELYVESSVQLEGDDIVYVTVDDAPDETQETWLPETDAPAE